MANTIGRLKGRTFIITGKLPELPSLGDIRLLSSVERRLVSPMPFYRKFKTRVRYRSFERSISFPSDVSPNNIRSKALKKTMLIQIAKAEVELGGVVT